MSDNIRDKPPSAAWPFDALDVAVDDGNAVSVDPKRAGIDIELPDGSIRINLGGIAPPTDRPDSGFDENLAEHVDTSTLGQMADELLRGIARDEQSRQDWIEQRAKGIRMLGLTIQQPHSAGGGDAAAPVEGQSTYIDPMILEAVVRFQANARSEFLPTDGPVKIRNDQQGEADQAGYALAQALQTDLNHYLTKTDQNYYADTDRMFLLLGLGGSVFKKVYHDPLKRRPVSETIDAEDLIVSNDVVDLSNAKRVTHRSFVRTSMLKRLQRAGVYRDVALGEPQAPQTNSVDDAKSRVSGIAPVVSATTEDQDHETLECHCEWDLPEGVWKNAGGRKLDGIPLPYRTTIDKTSQQILAIRRNWDEDDEWCLPTQMFVHYVYIRGIGFYGLGLLHLLGNIANGITAGTREMLDAGMMASFPGFLFASSTGRQKTNEFRVPAGGGRAIDTGGKPIQQTVMPLPYKEPSAALMTLIEKLGEKGQRLGGTAEVEVGEGRQDAPVGTTIALIEQATKPQNAVHKRMWESQSREIGMLIDRFREDPEALWRHNKKPATDWTKETFLQALDDNELVPVADPNTASHMERVTRTQTLSQVALASPPGLFNAVPVAEQIVRDMRLGDPKVLINYAWQPPAPDAKKGGSDQQPDPADMIDAQARAKMADAKMADVQAGIANRSSDQHQAQAEMQSKERIEHARLSVQAIQERDRQRNEAALQQDRAQDDARLAQQTHLHEMEADAHSQDRAASHELNRMDNEPAPAPASKKPKHARGGRVSGRRPYRGDAHPMSVRGAPREYAGAERRSDGNWYVPLGGGRHARVDHAA